MEFMVNSDEDHRADPTAQPSIAACRSERRLIPRMAALSGSIAGLLISFPYRWAESRFHVYRRHDENFG
jgi:hypothetical protein